MSLVPESRILCEGYHDRAFWDAWLRRLGCSDCGKAIPGTSQRDYRDPNGRRVGGGQFGFIAPAGAFIPLVPCQGDSGVLTKARLDLDELTTRPLVRLVINVDSDPRRMVPGSRLRRLLSSGLAGRRDGRSARATPSRLGRLANRDRSRDPITSRGALAGRSASPAFARWSIPNERGFVFVAAKGISNRRGRDGNERSSVPNGPSSVPNARSSVLSARS